MFDSERIEEPSVLPEEAPREIEGSQEQQEEREISPFELWAQKGIEQALNEVRERFEANEEDPDKNLAFHNTKHTESIVNRIEKILSAMKDAGVSITERQIARGKLYGAFHDVVQDEKEPKITPKGAFEIVSRVRKTRDNEEASWQAAIDFMEKANEEAGEEIFTKEDMEGAQEAILATVPGFDFVINRETRQGGTVVQPNLTAESSYEARALAFADIGAAGMEGYAVYGPEGDAVFREENLDILRASREPEKLTSEQKEFFRGRMIEWSKGQASFAEGRKWVLDKELKGLDPVVQEKLKEEVLNKFDDSIHGAKLKSEERKTMSFEELARDMGYNL